MSNDDWRTGPQTIRAHPQGDPRAETPGILKSIYSRLGLGGVFMGLGIQAVKYANQNYDTIRASSGPAVAIAAGLCATALVVTGVALMLRAMIRQQRASALAAAAGCVAPQTHPVQKPRKVGQAFFSFLGLTFGIVASFHISLATAARAIGTEKAVTTMNGSVLAAYGLALLSLAFGFAGIYLRRHSLMRVPAFFIIGGAVTYAAFHLLEVDIRDWSEVQARLR